MSFLFLKKSLSNELFLLATAISVTPIIYKLNVFSCYCVLFLHCQFNFIVSRIAGTWIDSRHTIHTNTVPPQLLKAVRGKTLSRERRKSDEELSPRNNKTKVSQSPSRKSAALFFDAFRPRSKSDATSKSKKPTNLISQMKNAVQVWNCRSKIS